MTKEERMINIYYDKTGLQILPGDLLRVDHYSVGKTKKYMQHVATIEESDFPVLGGRHYMSDRIHYRFYSICDAKRRIACIKIIHHNDWQSPRLRLKLAQNDK